MSEPPDFCSIVLCGGRSSRMGRDKATLPYDGQTMLERIVGVLASLPSCRTIILVAADDQTIPRSIVEESTGRIILTRDRLPNRGPLEGFAAGLLKVAELNPTVTSGPYFLTSCDVPQLQAAFVQAVVQSLTDGLEAAVPYDEKRPQPLVAAYDVSVLATVLNLLDQGRQSMRALLEVLRVRNIPVESLRSIDPGLLSLQNMNAPDDYASAVRPNPKSCLVRAKMRG